MPKSMKILIVTGQFAPNNTMGSVRLEKLAKYLLREGHDIRVLTTDSKDLPYGLPVEVPDEIVIRTRQFAVNTIPSKILGTQFKRMRQGKTRMNSAVAYMGKIYRTVFNFPDNYIGWVPFAIKEGHQLLEAWKADVIYASGPPHSSFIVARNLSLKHNIPWIAEYRDLWTDNHYYDYPYWRRLIEKGIDRRVLSSASCCITVADFQKEIISKTFSKPVFVITNGFDPEDIDLPQRAGDGKRDTLNIVYTGQIYPNQRDPSKLFRALQLLGDEADGIRVNFCGNKLTNVHPLAEQYGVSHLVRLHEPVSYKESLQIQCRSDLLLLLQWDQTIEAQVLPGKFFEYIAARRPIIYIGPEQGNSAQIIQDHGLGSTSNSAEGIAEDLKKWVAEKKDSGAINYLPGTVVDKFTRQEQFRKLDAVLEYLGRPESTRDLHYLSLESPQEGQASYAHVNEIVAGLRNIGWSIDLNIPSYTGKKTRPNSVFRLFEYARLQWNLIRRLKKSDIVYVRSHFCALPISLYCQYRGIKILQEVNGPYEDLFITYPFTRALKSLLVWAQRLQYKWADEVITVTAELGRWVDEEVNGRTTTLIPNGANVDLFRPEATTEFQLPDKYVVFFGGLARWQGIPTLIEAVADSSWPEDVTLVIIGGGQERKIVEEAAAANNRISYLGMLPYKSIPGIVANSLAGLVPKNNLGDRDATGLFPLKVFETLACGAPAIVTDFPGQADLVRENDCGLVIPAENPAALAHAVTEIAANPAKAKQMGEKGAALIQSDHSWQRRAEQTSESIIALL